MPEICIESSKKNQKNNSSGGHVKKYITMDMDQNLIYPSLSAEQSGKCYYMSPLIANILGIVDNSNESLKFAVNLHFFFFSTLCSQYMSVQLCLLYIIALFLVHSRLWVV